MLKRASNLFKVAFQVVALLCFVPDISADVSNSSLPPNIIEFEHLTTDDGLSSPIVMGVIQDHYGFMWFSTTNGINRYDGYSFKQYLPNPKDPTDPKTVGAAVVTGFIIDSKGLFWIMTYGGGVDRYIPETDTFVHYKHNPKDPASIGHNIVQASTVDREGNLWFATIGGGLNLYDRESDSFIRYQHNPADPHSIGSDKTFNVYEDSQGILWVTVDHGIDQFDRKNNRFIHFRHNPSDPKSLPNSFRWTIAEDHTGTIWFNGMDGGGLVRYDRKNKKFIQYRHQPDNPYSLSSNNVRNSYSDSKGTFWVATSGGGLNVYDRERDRFIRYYHDSVNPHSISYNDIIKVYEDRSGVLWFTTFGGGISKYDRKKERFKRMQQIPGEPNSLSHNDIHAIFQDSRGDLWVGTSNGLNRINSQTGHYSHFKQEADNPNSLSGNYVKRVIEDADGILWIATPGQGINRFDPKSKTFTHFQKEPDNANSLAENVCYSLYYDDEFDDLWIGQQSHASKFSISTNTYTHYSTTSFIESIYKDESGTLWLSGGAGLFSYNRRSDELKRVHKQPTSVIGGEKAGHLWLGTVFGLKKYNLSTNESKIYSVDNGLINNNIVGIVDDGANGLWLSTPKGLSHFNINEESFKNYDVASFNRGSVFFKSAAGELFFGGTNGIIHFYHDDIVNNPKPPPVVLTSFSKFNQPLKLKSPIWKLDSLDLTYQDRVFAFEFSALEFSDPKKNRYQYKLEGFDLGWAEVGSDRRIATYTNLDAGNYVFRVKAANNDGVWNEEGASIKIAITPPWWDTLWFKWTGLFILLLLSLAVLKYIRKLKFEVKERKSAEDAFRESESLLTSFTQALPDISFIFDEDGKYIKVFATQTELLVAEPERMEGSYINDMLPAETASKLLNVIQQTISTNLPTTFDYQLETRSGIRWFQGRTSPMKTKVDGRSAVVWISFDITNRKKSEEKVRQLSQFQESIIDNANIWLNVLDENSNVVIWNKAAEKISGYSREEVIGSSEVFLWTYPDEDYREEITKKAAEIIEGDEVKDFETIITCKDGSRKTISWYSRNVHDDTLKSIGSIALGIDMTERKQAETALRNSEEKYRDVVENATVAICVVQDERFKFFNIEALKLFGYSADELNELNVDMMVYKEDLELVKSARARRLRGEDVLDYSHRIKTKEGHIRWVYVKAVAISWEKESAALVFLTDITERKRAEELMIQTEKMMSVGGLAAGMAHELNNPLGGMLIGVQNVQRRLSSTLAKNQRVADDVGIDLDKLQPYIEQREINTLLNGIQESGKKAKEIILNMLQFSRKSESTMISTDMIGLMERALNLATKEYNLNKNIDFKTIRIEKQFDPDLPMISCNQTEIEQVLLNLLANAAWAMANEQGDTQPSICLRILKELEMIRIEIEDNGPGMDAEAKKRVFEPFYTTKPVGEGTGLGLSVSYMIVTNNHHGTMEVNSELGKGTTFIIRLPLNSEASLKT